MLKKNPHQIEAELNETHSNFQAAREQIGDLNLQVTILTSGKNWLFRSLFFKMLSFLTTYGLKLFFLNK